MEKERGGAGKLFDVSIATHLPVFALRRLPFLHGDLQTPLELRRFGDRHGFKHLFFAITNLFGSVHFLTHLSSVL